MTSGLATIVGKVTIVLIITWLVGIILALAGVFNRMFRK